MSNIVSASFYGSVRMVTVTPKYQYDQGQILKITGLDLPDTYKVDFSNYDNKEDSVMSVGSSEGAIIPDSLFETGLPIFAFVVVSEEDSVTTEYKINIPVIKRPVPTDYEPSQEEISIFDQYMARLNAAVEVCETAATVVGGLKDQVDGNSGAIQELNETLFGSLAEGETLNIRRIR